MRLVPFTLLIPLGFAFTLPATAQPNRPWEKLCPADATAYTGCTVKGTKRMVALCIPKGAQLEPTGEDDSGRRRRPSSSGRSNPRRHSPIAPHHS